MTQFGRRRENIAFGRDSAPVVISKHCPDQGRGVRQQSVDFQALNNSTGSIVIMPNTV